MGGLAKNRGIRAMIVDGAGRDTDELEDIGWPIWTRAITPRGTHTMFSGRKEELSINVPIQCGSIVGGQGPGSIKRELVPPVVRTASLTIHRTHPLTVTACGAMFLRDADGF
mgnify:CR=1 FL=1